MSEETNTQGRLEMQAYKADPVNVESPTANHKQIEKEYNAEILITQQDVLDSIVEVIETTGVSVKTFGAVGDGVTDDTAAIQATIDASDVISIPYGQYLISAPIVVGSFKKIYGAGRSAQHPYSTPNYTPGFRTEILIGAHVAFDFTSSNTTSIQGVSIKATAGGTSNFGFAANYVTGAKGFVISGSTNFVAKEVSFFGLEYGVSASDTTDFGTAAFGKITDIVASDCKNVIKLGNPSSGAYVGRDIIISDVDIALHCNQMIVANQCDGLRIENCRFFQSFGISVELENSPFVTLTGVTIFESTSSGLSLKDCFYVSAGALAVTRSGGYVTGGTYNAVDGIIIDGTTTVSLQGVVSQTGGIAVDISNSSNINLSLAILQPFFTNGNASQDGNNGCIDVTTSSKVALNCSLDLVSTNNIYSVTSDFESYEEIDGSLSNSDFCNSGRAFFVGDKKLTLIHELTADKALGAGGSSVFKTMRVWVPDGQSLVSRALHMTSPGVSLRVGSLFWTSSLITEADGGFTSFVKKTIITNATGTDQFYSIDFEVWDQTGGGITVPDGHMTLLSMALE